MRYKLFPTAINIEHREFLMDIRNLRKMFPAVFSILARRASTAPLVSNASPAPETTVSFADALMVPYKERSAEEMLRVFQNAAPDPMAYTREKEGLYTFPDGATRVRDAIQEAFRKEDKLTQLNIPGSHRNALDRAENRWRAESLLQKLEMGIGRTMDNPYWEGELHNQAKTIHELFEDSGEAVTTGSARDQQIKAAVLKNAQADIKNFENGNPPYQKDTIAYYVKSLHAAFEAAGEPIIGGSEQDRQIKRAAFGRIDTALTKYEKQDYVRIRDQNPDSGASPIETMFNFIMNGVNIIDCDAAQKSEITNRLTAIVEKSVERYLGHHEKASLVKQRNTSFERLPDQSILKALELIGKPAEQTSDVYQRIKRIVQAEELQRKRNPTRYMAQWKLMGVADSDPRNVARARLEVTYTRERCQRFGIPLPEGHSTSASPVSGPFRAAAHEVVGALRTAWHAISAPFTMTSDYTNIAIHAAKPEDQSTLTQGKIMGHPPKIIPVHDVPDKDKRNALVHMFVDQAYAEVYPNDTKRNANFWCDKLDKNIPHQPPTELLFVAQSPDKCISAALTLHVYGKHALVGYMVRSQRLADDRDELVGIYGQLLDAAKLALQKQHNVEWMWLESVRAEAGSPSAERSAVKMQAAEMTGLSMTMNADGEAHIHFEPSFRQEVADAIRAKGIEGLTQYFLHAIQLREDASPLRPALLEFKKVYYQADGVDNSEEKPSMSGVLLAHTLGQVINGAYLASPEPTPPDTKRAPSYVPTHLAA
jgi:hypothetical protein